MQNEKKKKFVFLYLLLCIIYRVAKEISSLIFQLFSCQISNRLMNHTQGLTTVESTTMQLIVPLLETIAINNSFRYTKFFDDFHQGENYFLRRLGGKRIYYFNDVGITFTYVLTL